MDQSIPKERNPERINQLTKLTADLLGHVNQFMPPATLNINLNGAGETIIKWWINQFNDLTSLAHTLGLKILSNLPKQQTPPKPIVVPNDQLNAPINPNTPTINPFPDTTRPIAAAERMEMTKKAQTQVQGAGAYDSQPIPQMDQPDVPARPAYQQTQSAPQTQEESNPYNL